MLDARLASCDVSLGLTVLRKHCGHPSIYQKEALGFTRITNEHFQSRTLWRSPYGGLAGGLAGVLAGAPTGLEDVDEAHEQRAQLLAVEGVLLLTHFHSQLLCDNVLQENADQLQEKPAEGGDSTECVCAVDVQKCEQETQQGKVWVDVTQTTVCR